MAVSFLPWESEKKRLRIIGVLQPLHEIGTMQRLLDRTTGARYVATTRATNVVSLCYVDTAILCDLRKKDAPGRQYGTPSLDIVIYIVLGILLLSNSAFSRRAQKAKISSSYCTYSVIESHSQTPTK